MSACESNSTLLLLATEEWTTITWAVLKSLTWLSLSTLDRPSPFNDPDSQAPVWICLVLLPFLPRAGLVLLLALGFSSTNKLSLWLFSVFASRTATLASKALLLSGVFFPIISPDSCAHTTAGALSFTLSHTLPWNISSTQSFFESAMCSAGLLPLGRYGLANKGNFHTQCWCSFIWGRWLLFQNSFCTCLVTPLLWQLLWTTCHTWCCSTGIKLLILDQDLCTHIPQGFPK